MEKLQQPDAIEPKLDWKALWGNRLFFPAAMWLLSRLLIVVAMMLIAPALPVPPNGMMPKAGWDVFVGWDSGWYHSIATAGYDYANDGKPHNIAFFPLFPLLVRAGMSLGLPFAVAGTLINNGALLLAMILLYRWVEERYSTKAARWATATLAWCPFSLFGTVVYTEGLFLVLSTAALRAFEKKQHVQAAIWGALVTATRPTGMALIPAFLITAWREKRSPVAYLASLAASSGLILYILYCWLNFGDGLAFVHVQKAWERDPGVNWEKWWKMLMQIVIGPANWQAGFLKDPWHPLIFLLICGCAWALWRSRKQLGNLKTGYGFCALTFFLWLLAGSPLVNFVMVLGGAYLLWHLRSELSLVIVLYGFCSIALILNSGTTGSAERYAYGIISLSVGLGVLLARYSPRWAYATMAFFGLLLTSLAIRFSQGLWAG